ncbi:hypothetical protein PCE1_001787 [Barthelona sp. PCE]
MFSHRIKNASDLRYAGSFEFDNMLSISMKAPLSPRLKTRKIVSVDQSKVSKRRPYTPKRKSPLLRQLSNPPSRIAMEGAEKRKRASKAAESTPIPPKYFSSKTKYQPLEDILPPVRHTEGFAPSQVKRDRDYLKKFRKQRSIYRRQRIPLKKVIDDIVSRPSTSYVNNNTELIHTDNAMNATFTLQEKDKEADEGKLYNRPTECNTFEEPERPRTSYIPETSSLKLFEDDWKPMISQVSETIFSARVRSKALQKGRTKGSLSSKLLRSPPKPTASKRRVNGNFWSTSSLSLTQHL